MNWIPLQQPLKVKVRYQESNDETHKWKSFDAHVLAWRWNERRENIEWLDIRGITWSGAQTNRPGVSELVTSETTK